MSKRFQPKKRPRSPFKHERSADLTLWIADGFAGGQPARVATDIEVSVGRTNSERAIGFVVYKKKTGRRLDPNHPDNMAAFVLDRDQVTALIGLLQAKLRTLRRPHGRKTDSFEFLRLTNPTVRLNTKLELAAMKAHPGWRHPKEDENHPDAFSREQDENYDGDEPLIWVRDPGAPDGIELIKWFEKTHPRKAQRIERDFTKRLWAGELI